MMRLKQTWVLMVAAPGVALAAGGEVSFNEEVRPVLAKHCIACHGPDDGDRKAGFRIDTFAGATADNDGVRGVVPGDLEASEVWYRVTTDEEDDVMPPADHGHKLSAEELDVLRRWILSGAEYEEHWAFVPPRKPAVPEGAHGHGEWARGAIDHFVAAKLEEKGLEPSPEADRGVLLRRAALDLTGLPPTREAVELFEQDRAAGAFERAVDRLLADPAFGERWAAMWLDLARYADTMGYASDNARTIWRWRDWVIEAFNRNLPYDAFTRLQMAGDLVEGAGEEGLLATAFHRNTLNNTEGGTDNEEFRTVAVKDRINTTVNVWMGLTMRCAECHTHKYDPISLNEYYAFMDLFNQTADADTNNDAPVERFLPVGAAARNAEIEAKIAALEAERAKAEAAGELDAGGAGWAVVRPSAATSEGGATLKVLGDGSVLASGTVPDFDTYVLTGDAAPGRLSALRLEVFPDAANGGNVGRHPNGSFAISQVKLAVLRAGGGREELTWGDAAADHVQGGHDIKSVTGAKPHDRGWAVGGGKGGYRAARTAVLGLKAPVELKEGDRVEVKVVHRSQWAKTNAGRVRASLSGAGDAVVALRAGGGDRWAREIAALRETLAKGVSTPVMRELAADQRRATHVNLRGNFMDLGERVEGAVLGSFHPLPDGYAADRLGVAAWLTAPENPLTARVTVNRFWARLFGLGLVETEEDFGTQGTMPSHPELLDYLAVSFVENGWDVKALLKEMVTSATYRQRAEASAEVAEKDPRNEWLSRGPRFRLPAEVVRDQALAVSGLLSRKMFGAPVYPPSAVKRIRSAFAGELVWKESAGEDRYRRALYTYLKRSQPHPLFETFDMNTREVCSMRRFRTNTPLQSFQTLNDPAFVEAAQAYARRMLTEGGDDLQARLRWGLRGALAREARDAEVEALAGLYEETLASYRGAPEEAVKMATEPLGALPDGVEVAEAAAMTVVANVIFNLDGFLTK